jgi:hypothetical protein
MKTDKHIVEVMSQYRDHANGQDFTLDEGKKTQFKKNYRQLIAEGPYQQSLAYKEFRAAEKELDQIKIKVSEAQAASEAAMKEVTSLQRKQREAQDNLNANAYMELEAQVAPAWKALKEAQDDFKTFLQQEATAHEIFNKAKSAAIKEYQKMKEPIEAALRQKLAEVDDITAHLAYVNAQADGVTHIFRGTGFKHYARDCKHF